MPSDEPILSFESRAAFRSWLAKSHQSTTCVWIRFFKKGSGVVSVTYPEALDEALCYGWIDGQLRRHDDTSFLRRFTPRSKRSIWSKINREHVARLIRDGRMQPAGLSEVERAKGDGRWDAAYDSPSKAKVPPDFVAALAKNRKAKAFFATLKRAEVFSICFRLHHAKKAETRARRIEQFIAMLAAGEKVP